jgi:hypothetical protein
MPHAKSARNAQLNAVVSASTSQQAFHLFATQPSPQDALYCWLDMIILGRHWQRQRLAMQLLPATSPDQQARADAENFPKNHLQTTCACANLCFLHMRMFATPSPPHRLCLQKLSNVRAPHACSCTQPLMHKTQHPPALPAQKNCAKTTHPSEHTTPQNFEHQTNNTQT